MKFINAKLFYLILLILAAGLISCEGPVGPAGPAGPSGSVGATGDSGNSNVTIITLPQSEVNWQPGFYFERPSNVFSLSASEVNQDIIDHGTVLGFMLFYSTWYTLPYIYENESGTSRSHIIHTFSLETINLYAFNTSGPIGTDAITEFRFLLITDNTILANSSESNIISKLDRKGVDTSNYYEVMDYYGLEY